MASLLPRYPIYIPSRGRWDKCLTAQCLAKDGVPFYLVIEEQEYEHYLPFGKERLIVLPWKNVGVEQLVKVRNWIKDHSIAAGHERHWQIDDNIRSFQRLWRSQRFYCNAGIALRVTEDFVDRYENVAIAGLNYVMFAPSVNKQPPFRLNAHVYSCTLILNAIPNRWRGPRNEDVDICLQVLADGWCTIQMNAFLAEKMPTMTMKGGNTHIYNDDGRLKMARCLERVWPHVVTTGRRYQRPQHMVADAWTKFDTPLKRKPSALPLPHYDIDLVQVKDELVGDKLKFLMNEYQKTRLAAELSEEEKPH